jgi:hypothetical protein
VNQSADFVMFWWDRAAEKLREDHSILRRFGLVTTNSITQVYNRRTIEKHTGPSADASVIMAIPDHPWSKVTTDSASVRIAMTVCEVGVRPGVVFEVLSEEGLDTDQPTLEFQTKVGAINADLSIGADVTGTVALKANSGICQQGVKLVGDGFIVEEGDVLRFRSSGQAVIKPYVSGRELVQQQRRRHVIDFFGFDQDQARKANPVAYERLLATVKPLRDLNRERSRRENWWLFGRSNIEMRTSLDTLPRYIATPEVAKHRPFVFVAGELILDASIYAIALNDPIWLGVLASRSHVVWTLQTGGTLEDRPRYHGTRCFDPFPFPTPDRDTATEIRAIAEELDAHRKARQAEHPGLTLTDMYNVLEKLRAGAALADDDKRIKDQGLVLMLKEYHDRLDAAVARAYGWPVDLTDEQILENLVALNAERAAEEKAGKVRWLRPDYQIPRFGSPEEKARWKDKGERPAADVGIRPAQGVLALPDDLAEMMPRATEDDAAKPKFPTNDEMAETAAVMTALLASAKPLTPTDVARHFKGGKQNERRVRLVLDALARLGHLSSADGGASYALRRGG